MPEAPDGPPLQLLSVDGVMVPLVGKEWAEVETLALGVVEEETNKKGESHCHDRVELFLAYEPGQRGGHDGLWLRRTDRE